MKRAKILNQFSRLFSSMLYRHKLTLSANLAPLSSHVGLHSLFPLFPFFLKFILSSVPFSRYYLNTWFFFSFVILQFSSNKAVACTISKAEFGCWLRYELRIIINFITSSFSNEEEWRCFSLVKSHDSSHSTIVKIWQPFLKCWGSLFNFWRMHAFKIPMFTKKKLTKKIFITGRNRNLFQAR